MTQPEDGDTAVEQASQHAEALAYLRAADPVLGQLIDRHPDFDPTVWLEGLPVMDVFGALVFQVIGQQLSIAAGRRILERLTALTAGHLPTPTEIRELPYDALRSTGLSGRKVETIKAVAAEFVAGTLSDASLSLLSDEEIEARLTAISGIGPWTVHGVLIIALSRPDVVLPGDLALRKGIRHAYGVDHLPSQAEVLQIAQAWRPYRTLATAYLFSDAFDA